MFKSIAAVVMCTRGRQKPLQFVRISIDFAHESSIERELCASVQGTVLHTSRAELIRQQAAQGPRLLFNFDNWAELARTFLQFHQNFTF